MSLNYNHITPNIIKTSILIELRNAHTKKIAEELIRTGIVPYEYLDKLLNIDMIQKQIIHHNTEFDNLQRIQKLIQLLQKHSISKTASFITNLYF